jgi:hypothetical protein
MAFSKLSIMARNKKEEAVEEVKVVKGQATVTYRGGVRTYTREVHGDDFAKLAKEFAEKRDGTVA